LHVVLSVGVLCADVHWGGPCPRVASLRLGRQIADLSDDAAEH
jgi:hypothetical protein